MLAKGCEPRHARALPAASLPTVRKRVPGKLGETAGGTGTLGRGSREKLPGKQEHSGRCSF